MDSSKQALIMREIISNISNAYKTEKTIIDYDKVNEYINMFCYEWSQDSDYVSFFCDSIYKMIYFFEAVNLNYNEKRMIHYNLIKKCGHNFIEPMPCAPSSIYDEYNIHHNMNKTYMDKYYNTINGLYKFINNDIIIDDLNDNTIDCIKTLLLISKIKIIPKCVIQYKILVFYLQ